MPQAAPGIAPSLPAADFARSGEGARAGADADWPRLDAADGRFVHDPISGSAVASAPRRRCPPPPVAPHSAASTEAGPHPRAVRRPGERAGVALDPATPATPAEDAPDLCDPVRVTSADPGSGGRSFLESRLPKTAAPRRMIESTGRGVAPEGDGGVAPGTTPRRVAAGAGTTAAGAPDYAAAAAALRWGSA